MTCTVFATRDTRCGAPATCRVYWPGKTLDMCTYHAIKAAGVAAVLTVEVLPPDVPVAVEPEKGDGAD